jgi:glycosyltransferase involved in cell wall biosynthesis
MSFECRECHRLGAYAGCLRKAQGLSARFAVGLLKWWSKLVASRALARCDRVVAVSDYVRQELVRSGRLQSGRVVTLPNLVDLPSVERALGGPWPLHDISPETPFLLFAGKLDLNKGAQLLAEALEWSGVTMPVVLAGDGPLRVRLEEEAGRRGLSFRFYDWLDNDSVLLLMRHAQALLFPSAWQEPLSRVLLEGCAAGAAIVALDTGGTGDIITHGESGLLAGNLADFSRAIKQVVEDDELNARLREGARRRAEKRFAAPVVSACVESLYYELLDGLRTR